MEELLTSLYENSNVPLLSAFFLGLLTAISPCPMATNITAIGYIGKDIEVKRSFMFSNASELINSSFPIEKKAVFQVRVEILKFPDSEKLFATKLPVL